MSEVTLARPYARSLYELASSQDRVQAWDGFLGLLEQLLKVPDFVVVANSPILSKKDLLELVEAILGDKMDAQGRNLLGLLLENGRLGLVPEIAVQFRKAVTEANLSIAVHVVSATKLTDDMVAALAKSLKAKWGKDPEIDVSVDKTLIGGAVIHAGDTVIDASIRGQVEKLAYALAH